MIPFKSAPSRTNEYNVFLSIAVSEDGVSCYVTHLPHPHPNFQSALSPLGSREPLLTYSEQNNQRRKSEKPHYCDVPERSFVKYSSEKEYAKIDESRWYGNHHT